MSSATTQDRQRHKRPISNQSTAKSTTSQPASLATSSTEEIAKAAWRSLFFFTTKANLPLLTLAIISSIIAGAASPGQAFIVGKVFDGFTSYAAGSIDASQLMQQVQKWVLYLVGIAVASWVFHSLEFTFWLAFGELQAKGARDRLFHGLLEKDTEWYDMRKNGIGALLPRLQAQIRDLQLATAQPLGSLFTFSATSILSIAQAFYYSWDLTLVTLATAPFIIFIVFWLGNGMQAAMTKQQDKLNEAQKFSTSAFSAIETVKCFNGQDIEVEKYMSKIYEAAHWNVRVMNASGLQMGFAVLLAVSMFVQGFYYGGILISGNKRTTAEVVTCFMSAIGGFQAIQSLIPQMIFLEKGRNSGATLRAIMAKMEEGSTVQRRAGLIKPMECRGEVSVQNLTFAYPSRPEQMALNDVTLFIPAGEMTFLIGKSGSGKSTLGQLLMRFYSTNQGKIALDGVSLESLDVDWLRSKITLVEQTSFLFNDTVFRNIAFGKRFHNHVSKEEVMEAAQFALLQLMLNDMPDGLETMVGYKGGTLSGGQRQRMALARARLRDTPILILDESTSALDHISRGLIMDAIRQWRRGKTTIVITHDITQILPDDYLYLLEGGKLAQEGYRKHLEVLPDTAFQRFLPVELRATAAPFDARKGTAFDSITTTGSSIDLSMRSADRSNVVFDPLEARLLAGEHKHISFMPGIYVDGYAVPSQRPFGGLGPTSTMASPWLRVAVSPPTISSPVDPNQLLRSSSGKSSGPNLASRAAGDSSRWSQLLRGLVDRTGRLAADTRTKGARAGRRRPMTQDLESARRRQHFTFHEKPDHAAERDDQPQSRPLSQILRSIWPTLDSASRIKLMLGFWGGAIHAAGTPAFSYALSKLLGTYAVPGGDKHKSLIYSMAILCIAVTDATHSWLFRRMFGVVSQTWIDNTRSKAFRRILGQPRSFFDREENSTSNLTDCLDRNADDMGALLSKFTPLVFCAAFMCGLAVIWSLATQWEMTLIALVVAPYILGVTKAFSAVSSKWEALSNDASASAASIFAETFINIKTVRALTLERHFKDKYITATNHALVIGFQRSIYAGFFYGLSDSSGLFSTAMVFYVGAKLVTNGASVSGIVQVFLMLIFAITNVTDILSFIPQISNAQDTASRMMRFADLTLNSHEHRGNTRIIAIGDIVFRKLRFAYPSRPEQTILRNINLSILPGSSTAIVGGSGSGKSTIANLLLELYSTAEVEHTRQDCMGELTINGRQLHHIHTPSLRSLIVPVSQTPTLFAASVRDNITYGLPVESPHNTLQAVESAAQQAGVHEFICSLPLRYDTLIGDGGMGLSGGQAQRVAIARALVRKPTVLILDEATSALDVQSADLVRQTIKNLLQDPSRSMTVIIITHNREMMEIAERIVVLDQGSIVEEGGFEELLARNGALSNLLSGGEWDKDRDGQTAGENRREVPKLRDVDWKARKKHGRYI